MSSFKLDRCFSCSFKIDLDLQRSIIPQPIPQHIKTQTLSVELAHSKAEVPLKPGMIGKATMANIRSARLSNPPELKASKYNFFRDFEVELPWIGNSVKIKIGNKIAGAVQALSGSTKDGAPYSHLGNYFPSNKDIQDGQFFLTVGSLGPIVLRQAPALSRLASTRTGLDEKKALFVEKASTLGTRIGGRRDDVRGAWNARDQVISLDKKSVQASKKMRDSLAFSADVQTNAVAVSATYGLGSNLVGGLPLTSQTALGSGLIGLFLAKTAPHMITKMAAAGYSQSQRMAALYSYRGATWGLYGAAATGDLVTSLSMLAGGAWLTRVILPTGDIIKSSAPAMRKVIDVTKIDAAYLIPGVLATGWAKNRTLPEQSVVLSEAKHPKQRVILSEPKHHEQDKQ